MIKLVILDMYGTIIGQGFNTTPRNGFIKFIDKLTNIKVVIVTDYDQEETIKNNLKELGILNRLNKIYTYKDMRTIKGRNHKVKDLNKICLDFNINKEEVIFISDADVDFEDAKREGIKFIHVPFYISKDELFSFDLIDLSKELPDYLDLRQINE